MRNRRLFLAVLALHAAGAAAQTRPTASLRVERSAMSESCPGDVALRAEVDRRLGRASFSDDAPRAVLVQYLPTQRRRWRARVSVREGSAAPSHRDLVQEGPGCAALAGAVALAVALVIDPDAALRPPPPVVTAPAARSCPEALPVTCPTCDQCLPQTPVLPRAAPAPPPRRALPPSWLAITGGVVVGVVPGAAPIVGLTLVTPLRTHWSLAVGASYVPPASSRDGAASVGRTAARVGVCLDTAPTWLQVGGCVDALAGVLHLAALDLQPVSPGDRAWLAAAVEAHARWFPGSRWVLSVQTRAVVPLLTWAPRVEGAADASYVPSPVAFEADLAVGVRLP